MPKFFVEDNQIKDDKITILNSDVKHIQKVLRKNIGDILEICNKDDSTNYLCEILKLEKDKIICQIKEKIDISSESNIHINIYQGLPKSDKMEYIIQKCVELGASEITPVAMSRCVVKIDSKDEKKKITRWQNISEVAAKQCGRDIIPKINNIENINDVCKNCSKYDIVLVAYENEKENKLKDELKKIIINKDKIKIAIVIGPEGGLEEKDVLALKNVGGKVITLGKRILRTETVALNMISIIMYELEN